MKKIKLFSALALTLVMASCDNFDLPNPPGQSNPAPDSFFADADFEMAPVSEAISLPAANEANQFVTVANITKLDNFPAEYTLAVDMEVGSDAQFTKTTTIATTIAGDAVTVNPDILNGAIQSAITKAPGQYEVNSRFIAYAVKDDTRLRLGGINNYYLTEALDVTTYDAEKVIENAYYFVPCDAAGTPQWSDAVAMNNNSGAGSIGYDHPEFSLKIDSPDPDGCYFMIAPQSVYEAQDASQLFGGNPAANGLSGKLGADYSVVHVAITGDVLVTINVEDDSYVLSYAFNALYPWSAMQSAANIMLLRTTDYINYTGVCALNNEWWITTTDKNNSTPLFKQSPDSEAVTSKDELTITGEISNTSDLMIKTPAKGTHLYWVAVDLPNLTYSITALNTLSLIGNHNDWKHETSTDLKGGSGFKGLRTWTATDVELNGEFKIACNKEWGAVDFGGEAAGTDNAGNLVYNLTMKGGNMNAPEGKYDVTVDFSGWPYVLTLKKK